MHRKHYDVVARWERALVTWSEVEGKRSRQLARLNDVSSVVESREKWSGNDVIFRVNELRRVEVVMTSLLNG